MKSRIVLLMTIALLAAVVRAPAQGLSPDEQQALRARIEQRYDIVPLTDGVGLRPKSRTKDVRLIEVSDTIAINGVPVSGRELREKVGADAETILRLSYLDADARRELFLTAPQAERPVDVEPGAAPVPPPPAASPRSDLPRSRRSNGDRVRIFGDVSVGEGEEVSGQVVAVMGNVRIDGRVDEQVVAVLGGVDLGPHADVRGDVVTVGGRLHRAPGAQVGGAVTEVSPGLGGILFNAGWAGGFGPFQVNGFRGGPVARLFGSAFRIVLLMMLACAALVVARRPVENSAQRVADDPVKSTLVGLAAWVLFGPVLLLLSFVLMISLIGIPLLLFVPFAVVVLLLMALAGFSGTACTVGQWMRGRFGLGSAPAFLDVCLGVFVIVLPLMVGRTLALAGWPFQPFVFLLVAVGLMVEFLAWSSGLGAVLTNAFARWSARRALRATVTPPPVTP
ncbi:MAG: polymer-forming cytoskeletal protein [Acidobacteriota bacterium]